jgi:hypothetical protein
MVIGISERGLFFLFTINPIPIINDTIPGNAYNINFPTDWTGNGTEKAL